MPIPPSSRWELAAAEPDLAIPLPGGLQMRFRRVPAGDFHMGSRGYLDAEEPIHRVVVPHDFYLGRYPVTQEEWAAVARHCPKLRDRAEPSRFKGPRRPVEQVSWHDANDFCDWLERNVTVDALPEGFGHFRLPSEAEWEYACRAGTETEYYSGDGEAALTEAAWYDGNSGRETHEVGGKAPNPIHLHDMHGNVWEWCRDVWDARAYRKRTDGCKARKWAFADAGADAETFEEAKATEANATRVLRGGSWIVDAGYCRSAFRFRYRPGVRYWSFGMRVCLVPGPVPTSKSSSQPAGRAEAGQAGGDAGPGKGPESRSPQDFPSAR